MKAFLRFATILLFLSLLNSHILNAQPVSREFKDPPREFSVMPFWFWNDTLKDEEIIRQIADFEAHGVYGFVIHPRIGLPANVKWLGPEMIHSMNVAISEAAKRKMFVVLYDEGMYPSGSSSGQVVARNPAHAARGLAKIDLKPGQQPQLAQDQKLVTVIGRKDGSMVAVIDQPSGGNIRGLHYIGEGSEGRLREESPAAGDILNPDAVTSFMELVYDKYAKEFGKYFGSTILGIFTDEPSPLGRGGARGVVAGNAGIMPQINKILGYDITPFLSDLWYNDNPESLKHRVDYNRAVNICLEENYYKRLGNWCREHGIALMGHPAGSMDIGAERYFQIPGQDLVWRYVEPGEKAIRGEHSTMAKCASSAMLHLGLSRNANELYGAYGHNLTFDELEWLANWCFVRGQNFLIPHAFYYSTRGPRFEERPPDVGPNSAWWNNYKPYADACRRLSWLNTGSKQVCDIAVLCEATYLPDRTPEILFRNQKDFNYLEIRHLWEDAKVSASGIKIAGMEYKAVVLDSLSAVPAEASSALKILAAAGRLLIWENSSLSSSYKGAVNISGKEQLMSILNKLTKADLSLEPASESIRYRHVVKNGINYYLLFNEEEKTVRTRITISEKGTCYKVDPYTVKAMAFIPGREVEFKPHELILLVVSGKKELNAPEGLMTEFIRDPDGMKIMDLRPEFSWIVPPTIKKQKAYQVLVSKSMSALDNNQGDVWDSGKIISASSTVVEFANGSLKNNTRYFWKVRIWNEKDLPSEYSELQTFVTGNPTGYATTGNKFQAPLISPERIRTISSGHYLVDFGKDAFGTIILKMNAPSETNLTIHLGEKLTDEGMIDRNPGGSVRYSKTTLTVKPGLREYVMKLPADKRNTSGAAVILPDSFGVITPFRYCEVENYPSELKPSEISRKTYHYYFEEDNSSFSSSDTILNRIWDQCKYSIKATSFAGLYIDGDRERIPYEADAYINQLGHYYTDREYSIARLTNEYFIGHPTWPTEWILHTVPMFYNDYMFTGNLESVKANYEKLREKTLYRLAGADGLISVKNLNDEIMRAIGFSNQKERLRDIVDWPPAQKDTGWKLVTPEGERDGYDMVETNTMVNALYYRSLVDMSILADALGKKDDSEFFSSLAAKVKDTFTRELLNGSTGAYVDGVGSKHSSLHANMTALAFGLVPDESKSKVVDFIKSRGMACSVYGAQYLLEGLYRAGAGDYALELLTSQSDRSWWNMIRSGSTITMEAWDMKYKPNSDLNHAWGAAPANIIPGYLWGIEPAEPGYAKARISPQTGILKSSNVVVPTIRGNIEAAFTSEGKKTEYQITLPGNMEGEFAVQEDHSVYLNNKPAKAVKGILKLSPGTNIITVINKSIPQ